MRLFIGIPVEQTVRERLQPEWERIKPLSPDCRMIEAENWHFTLAFLGDVPSENLMALKVLVAKGIENPPKGGFTFTDFRTFPYKRASYIIAKAEVASHTEWEKYIEGLREMVSVAAPHIDRKPWVPHITLCRARRGRALPEWQHPIEHFEWHPKKLTLIQSTPGPNGHAYTPLHVFPVDF